MSAAMDFDYAKGFSPKYGYPALTPTIKSKIFSGNSLRLYDVKPVDTKCQLTRAELDQLRKNRPGGNAAPGPKTAREAAGPRRRLGLADQLTGAPQWRHRG